MEIRAFVLSFAAARQFVWRRVLLIHFFTCYFIRPGLCSSSGCRGFAKNEKGKIQSNLSTFPLCKFISQCRANEWATVTLAVIRQSARESWTFNPGAKLMFPSDPKSQSITVIVHQNHEIETLKKERCW